MQKTAFLIVSVHLIWITFCSITRSMHLLISAIATLSLNSICICWVATLWPYWLISLFVILISLTTSLSTAFSSHQALFLSVWFQWHMTVRLFIVFWFYLWANEWWINFVYFSDWKWFMLGCFHSFHLFFHLIYQSFATN